MLTRKIFELQIKHNIKKEIDISEMFFFACLEKSPQNFEVIKFKEDDFWEYSLHPFDKGTTMLPMIQKLK